MTPFGRRVALEFGVPGSPGRRYEDLAVTFRVEMTQTSTPNTADIEARNLSADAVALVQRSGAVVRLLVGYDAPRLIFQGTPVKNGIDERIDGTDRVLRLELNDGGRTYQLSRVGLSYATPTTVGVAFDALAAQLGLPLGTLDLDRSIDLGPMVLQGPAREALDTLAGASGARWSIQDGVLHVVSRTGAIAESAVVFSADAGNLIGSPGRKDGGLVEVRGLIAPSLRPGKPFRVESTFVTGDYVATKVDFIGGLYDNDFHVIATGRPRRSA